MNGQADSPRAHLPQRRPPSRFRRLRPVHGRSVAVRRASRGAAPVRDAGDLVLARSPKRSRREQPRSRSRSTTDSLTPPRPPARISCAMRTAGDAVRPQRLRRRRRRLAAGRRRTASDPGLADDRLALAEGFEIGSHGRMHLAADVNSQDLIERDARASRLELEDHIGRAVRSFAYPFGFQTGARSAQSATAGLLAGLRGRRPPRASRCDRWALPRLQVCSDTTPEALLASSQAPSGAAGACVGYDQADGFWHLGRRWAGWGPTGGRTSAGAWR